MKANYKKKTNKKRKPRPEHERLADAIISRLPRSGYLIWLTLRLPPLKGRGHLHEDFTRFCADHTEHSLVVLEYGPHPKEVADVYGDSDDGEHVHVLVWVRDDKAFARAAHDWAERMSIHEKARDWDLVTGWLRYRDHGRPSGRGNPKRYLRPNLVTVIEYVTKPGERDRDFPSDGIARGLFAHGWQSFCNETTSRPSVTLSWFCPVCWNGLERQNTGRPARYCSGTCRQRANRHPWLKDPSWRYTLITRGRTVRLVRWRSVGGESFHLRHRVVRTPRGRLIVRINDCATPPSSTNERVDPT
jgi:hypothetical protein